MGSIADLFELVIAIFVVGSLAMFAFGMFFACPLVLYDQLYVMPQASQKANLHCQDMGFDFYESYSRIGILSKNPVAIKCKYVDQYKQIDLNRPLIEIGT